MSLLFVIPARGGSKGIPGKNIKKLGGKPLIEYAIEIARQLADDKDICVSTDSSAIKAIAEMKGLPVPFLRPAELATDTTGTYEVLLHALDFYKSQGQLYDKIVLLQPTSPFRKEIHVREAIALWEEGLEMIVSVKESKSNPYYTLFEENEEGYLVASKIGNYPRRQDCPIAYEYNGAVYVIDVKSLLEKPLQLFTKKKKYIMDEESSLDLDTALDWKFAEYLISEKGYER